MTRFYRSLDRLEKLIFVIAAIAVASGAFLAFQMMMSVLIGA